MAVATSTAIGLGLAAAAAGAQYYNTQQTAKRTDEAAAQGILNQSRQQQQADTRVGEEVAKLAGSNAQDERQQRLGEYFDIVKGNRATMQEGLAPGIGSDQFKQAANDASMQSGERTANVADLMSRIDAAHLQRQGEGTSYGRLGTDLSGIGRRASGLAFLDDLRARNVRRDPYLDAFSALAGGASGAIGSNTTGVATNTGSKFYKGGG